MDGTAPNTCVAVRGGAVPAWDRAPGAVVGVAATGPCATWRTGSTGGTEGTCPMGATWGTAPNTCVPDLGAGAAGATWGTAPNTCVPDLGAGAAGATWGTAPNTWVTLGSSVEEAGFNSSEGDEAAGIPNTCVILGIASGSAVKT
jgi:hypothetical protein